MFWPKVFYVYQANSAAIPKSSTFVQATCMTKTSMISTIGSMVVPQTMLTLPMDLLKSHREDLSLRWERQAEMPTC